MHQLFTPYDLSGISLANRVVMAPLTRTRTLENNPDALTALYYAQRASAGLIVTEGLPVSDEGRGYLYTPGIHSDIQGQGWRQVTDAVHAKGGNIFAQLWHVGRMSHVSIQPGNAAPVGPSDVAAENTTVYAWIEPGKAGPVLPSAPRALTVDEIARVTADFVHAAKVAIDAGFDGIEIMAANGFLFDQFLSSAVNTRTDQYGGSIANRQRFLLETIDALSAAIGSGKVGVRISPFGRLYDMRAYADEAQVWSSVAQALDTKKLAYVHLNYQPTITAAEVPAGFGAQFRQDYHGTLIGAGGFTQELARSELEKGDLDLIAFGMPFISNPDLVERMQNNWPLADSDRSTYYGASGAPSHGYTDYPAYGAAPASNMLNGINVAALQQFAQGVAGHPDKGEARFNVKTRWQHQTRSVATVSHYVLGGEKHARHFEIASDEPHELLGQNTAPNPQELLMAALNACLSVGYAANAAAMGITVHSLEIETDGKLDLRGFLGLDENVNPGYDEVSYVVRLRTDASRERVEALHQAVTKTSVNLANFSKAIRMLPTLEVIEA